MNGWRYANSSSYPHQPNRSLAKSAHRLPLAVCAAGNVSVRYPSRKMGTSCTRRRRVCRAFLVARRTPYDFANQVELALNQGHIDISEGLRYDPVIKLRSGGIEMKFVMMLIVVALVFVLGGVLGIRLAGSGLQADVPQQAVVAQAPAALQDAAPAAPQAAAPAAPQEAAPVQVGLVGVLQAIGSQSLSVQTTEGMRLLTINGSDLGNGSAPINQLRAGDKVALWTQNIQGHNVVTKVVVIPQSPTRIHYVGVISSLNGDKIDVVGLQGETTTFRIDQTLQNLPDANRKPHMGDAVTVVAKRDPLGDGWLAVAIVKQ